ncbi:MAG TPA: tetraacyldisaccharide 4'-kinase [Candidatus Polarisedimenticolia bacterium]|nr:tetraacyldisaccharide 4'-kinase [Candidatus Polarisedimenticolia bacterium]
MDPRFPAWLCALLYPAGLVYRSGVMLRNSLYRRGALPVFRLDIPVISVGNLIVGGTGKTPFVAYLAARLRESGRRVAVASRGYGGIAHSTPKVVSDGSGSTVSAKEVGDEPVLLAQALPSVGVVVCRDRAAAARTARDRLRSDLVILDDGFQHRRLARDLDLLLVGAEDGFGNGRMLPCGPLREPLGELARCDAIVVTGAPRQLNEAAGQVRKLLQRMRLDRAIFLSERHLDGFVRLDTDERIEPQALKGMRALAFSGIARPLCFERDLEAAGIELVDTLQFRDHQTLGASQVETIRKAVRQSRPDVVITTEKDRVRLGSVRFSSPVYAARIRMIPVDEEGFLALVTERISEADRRAAGLGR